MTRGPPSGTSSFPAEVSQFYEFMVAVLEFYIGAGGTHFGEPDPVCFWETLDGLLIMETSKISPQFRQRRPVRRGECRRSWPSPPFPWSPSPSRTPEP